MGVLGQNKLEWGPAFMLHVKEWLHKTLKNNQMSCCVYLSLLACLFFFIVKMTYCCCPVPSLITSGPRLHQYHKQSSFDYSTLTCISNASPVNPREESLMTWQHKSLAITVLLHDDLFSMQENETEHRSLQNSRNSEIFEIQKQDILESLCVIMHLKLQKDDGAKMIYVYVYMWPWTAKAVLRHWVIFVAMAKNTLYGSE